MPIWPLVEGDPFDVTDPSGLRVVASDSAWAHVVREHPEFGKAGMLDAAATAVEKPMFITDDRVPSQKQAYYAIAPAPYRTDLMLKVTVKLKGSEPAVVTTAHITPSIGANEAVIWRKDE